jgi:nitroimidazol reductase NimA-like FMN-containing flavoprotein (pyridoxamine 5'-phosphate oxidase superfamily)
VPIPAELSLTEAERDAMLDEQWNMRIATHSPTGRINLTPLWFVWHEGRVWAWCRGQKVENLRANPECTVLVDRNEAFPELQGIMIQGRATVLEDDEAEAAEPGLPAVKARYGRKYDGGHGQPAQGDAAPPLEVSARGRTWRWVTIEPTHVVSWDNRKLPGGGH